MKKKLTESQFKTLIRWGASTIMVTVTCIFLIMVVMHPYEIRFSADANVRDSIIATSEAIKEQNTITENPILIDKEEFVQYCLHKNPPSIISCVVGCSAYRNNEHTRICGEGVACKWDGELDCNVYCEKTYGIK